MKTNMKTTSIKAISALLICLTFFHVSAFAEGGSSGSGNGDDAFALQVMAQNNPGLTPFEILSKAFEESSGRIPDLFQDPESIENHGSVTTFRYYLLKQDSRAIKFESKEDEFGAGFKRFVVYARSTNSGHLLVQKIKLDRMIKEYDMSSVGPIVAPVINASVTGLVSFAISNYEEKQKYMEFRKLDPKTVVYVRYPYIEYKDGKALLTCEDDRNNVHLKTKKVKYCEVGYLWVD